MISMLFLGFKFVVRFIFIFILLVALLFGGYTLFLHKENGFIDDILISQLNSLKQDERFVVSEIKEVWDENGLQLSSPVFEYKDNKNNVVLKGIKLKVDLIQSIQEKRLSISMVSIDNLNIEIKKGNEIYTDSTELKKQFDVNALTESLKKHNININEIHFSVKNFELKIEDKNIDITGIKVEKRRYSSIVNASYNDKVQASLVYDVDLETGLISLKTYIDSNRFYLKRIMTLLGQDTWIDFIHFDKIYSVVGDLKSSFSFKYNFKEKEFLDDYKASILLNGNKVVLNAYDSITLTNAKGYLYYDKKGFYSNDIIANLDRKRTLLRIHQENKKEDIVFEFETKADIEKLSEIANFPLYKILKGNDSFKGFYKLNFNKTDELVVESDFTKIDYNTEIKLKNKNGFKLKGFFDYDKNKLNFDIKQGDHEIQLNFIDGKIYNVLAGINKTPLNKKDKGIFVTGFLKEQDLVSMIQSMDDLNKKFSNKDLTSNKIKESDFELLVDVSLKNTKFSDQVFDNIDLMYQNKTLSLTFNEEKAEGYFYYNENTKEIELNLKKIKVNKNKATELVKEKISENKQEIQEFDYSSLLQKNYKINIMIEDFSLSNINHINLKTSGEIKDGNLIMNEFHMTDNLRSFDLNGKYKYDGKENRSSIVNNGKDELLVIHDLKSFNKQNFKDFKGFESKKIVIDGELYWNDFKLEKVGETLDGNLSLFIDEGFVNKNNASIGLLKTLNIFNFDSWLKMFTFNFEEIEEGLHFNNIKGSFNIKDNVVNISPRIILDSDLFILEFTGEIDYIKNIYSVNIEAVVPLLNKAPAIALFAGVAPEIVGVIWLVDKLAGNVINDAFTRSKFKVSGSFDNPVFTKGSEETYKAKENKKSDLVD